MQNQDNELVILKHESNISSMMSVFPFVYPLVNTLKAKSIKCYLTSDINISILPPIHTNQFSRSKN